MADQVKVFISYKTGQDNALNFQANTIRSMLEQNDYNVWMDTTNMQAGKEWNHQIYRELAQTDVMLLLLADETKDSRWVQREVDVARGAKTSILPVLVQDQKSAEELLQHFDLTNVQYVDFRTGTDNERDDLVNAIDGMKQEARENRRKWLAAYEDDSGARAQEQSFRPAKNNKTYAVYQFDDNTIDTQVLLATGDMAEFRNVDVLVNTENNFMQMARIFEHGKLSSALRRAGSNNTIPFEDRIQDELNLQISTNKKYALPLQPGSVIPTRAGQGDPKSELAKRNVRYIFHATTVMVNLGGRQPITPIDTFTDIYRTIKNLVEQAIEIDENQGVFFQPGVEQYEDQVENKDKYRPIKSMALPIFGTGHGGRSVADVVPDMVEGIHRAIADFKNRTNLRCVYLCVYSSGDIDVVQQALNDRFNRVASPSVDCR